MRQRNDADLKYCREILPSVSRTFALTIRVLPSSLRDPVTVAYLLCRMADALEDATGADPLPRIQGLSALSAAVAGWTGDPVAMAGSLDEAAGIAFDEPSETGLLRDRLRIFRAFSALPDEERAVVARWVRTMALGMSGHVVREMRPGRESPYVLETRDELRSYAYFVAGTVGHLLTDLFTLHLGRRLLRLGHLRELAVPFGLGLQFTNILQDLSDDRRRGWVYVPDDLARRHGTSSRSLQDPAERGAALRVVAEMVKEAAGYLDRAMEYTLLLPRRAPRLRLFCLWPIFFALRTLVRVWGEERVLTGGEKVRITRTEVRRVVGMTCAACLSNRALERLYRGERARLDERIALRPI